MENKFMNTLEEFNETDPVDLANFQLPKKLETGIKITSGIFNMAVDLGAYKLTKAVAKPIIDAETRVPMKILYKIGCFGITGMVSIGVRGYMNELTTTLKTGIKAGMIIHKVAQKAKEEENGQPAEQVCEG